MLNSGKRNVLGILIDAVDCEAAVEGVLKASRDRKSFAVSALAVHGLMTGVLDPEQKFRLNQFDLLVSDGQPIRWVLNWLHRIELPEPVIGRNLTLRVCARAADEGIPVYFYGCTPQILGVLKQSLMKRFPTLQIAGLEPSKFRRLIPQEQRELADRVRESGAAILFVGIGCPRQEIFAFEFRKILSMPILAVGAAFPFLADKLPAAPQWMQEVGLEWFFRLMSEPRRLWRRYVLLNPAYLFLVVLQAIKLVRFKTAGRPPEREMLYG